MAKTKSGGPPAGAGSASGDPRPAPTRGRKRAAGGPAAPVPPDADRLARGQRLAAQADLLAAGVFPALMASALGLDAHLETAAYREFLARVVADLGGPLDPLARMLVEQVCLAHFRVAALHVGAAAAKGGEATKLYTACAARLLGEMRRTVLAVKELRAGTPAGAGGPGRLKLYMAAR